jgi:hypothetical protein
MWPIKTSVYPTMISMPAMLVIRASRTPLCKGEGGEGFVRQRHQREPLRGACPGIRRRPPCAQPRPSTCLPRHGPDWRAAHEQRPPRWRQPPGPPTHTETNQSALVASCLGMEAGHKFTEGFLGEEYGPCIDNHAWIWMGGSTENSEGDLKILHFVLAIEGYFLYIVICV